MCAEKVTINSLKAVPDPTIYLRGDLTVPEVPDTLWKHHTQNQLCDKVYYEQWWLDCLRERYLLSFYAITLQLFFGRHMSQNIRK